MGRPWAVRADLGGGPGGGMRGLRPEGALLPSPFVIPAQAGIQWRGWDWIPACAGMTNLWCCPTPPRPLRLCARPIIRPLSYTARPCHTGGPFPLPPFEPRSVMPARSRPMRRPAAPPVPARKAGRADGFHQLKGGKAWDFNDAPATDARVGDARLQLPPCGRRGSSRGGASDARFGAAVAAAAAVALAAIGEGQGADLRLAAVGPAAVAALGILIGLHRHRTFHSASGQQARPRSGHDGGVSQRRVNGSFGLSRRAGIGHVRARQP